MKPPHTFNNNEKCDKTESEKDNNPAIRVFAY